MPPSRTILSLLSFSLLMVLAILLLSKESGTSFLLLHLLLLGGFGYCCIEAPMSLRILVPILGFALVTSLFVSLASGIALLLALLLRGLLDLRGSHLFGTWDSQLRHSVALPVGYGMVFSAAPYGFDLRQHLLAGPIAVLLVVILRVLFGLSRTPA